ncbi:MAG: nuclear transport factor 2 family protein [Saprospiraceae bacterium]
MKKSLILFIASFFILACNKSESSEKPDYYAPTSEATQLADEQLAGYNKRDMEAFLLPYSDSVKVFYNLKEFAYQGKDKMRENYNDWFGSLTYLNCKIVNRIASGNTVIDHEELTFKRANGQEGKSEAMAIYKISNGKIQEVYFTKP